MEEPDALSKLAFQALSLIGDLHKYGIDVTTMDTGEALLEASIDALARPSTD